MINQYNQMPDTNGKYNLTAHIPIPMPTRNIFDSSDKINWKKTVADKLVQRITRHRERRMDDIRMNKPEIISEVHYEEMLTDNIDEENLLMSDFYNRLFRIWENANGPNEEYEIELNSESVSICPICSYPVVYLMKKIICLNLCFEYVLPSGSINSNFTLDNFVDIYRRTYRDHELCMRESKYKLGLLFLNDDAECDVSIYCEKCILG